MDKALVKLTIEDVAFNMWDDSSAAVIFATDFLSDYPGFGEFWDSLDLANALEERV